ncbi:serine acetyltransferase [archaeon]|nr:MAG: serine acetyltransferase [archaeon]
MIHVGEGLMIDHGTGVVIGETVTIGRNCSFLHGVTLGSTGKEKGDRHPKIGHDVLIGCGSTILGNITIGSCCKIGSGSMVLKPLPPGATAVGNPAKIVGRSMCRSAAEGMDLALRYVVTHDGVMFDKTLVATEEEKWIESEPGYNYII